MLAGKLPRICSFHLEGHRLKPLIVRDRLWEQWYSAQTVQMKHARLNYTDEGVAYRQTKWLNNT